KTHDDAITGFGIRAYSNGIINDISKKELRYLKAETKVKKMFQGHDNLKYFFLGYGQTLKPSFEKDPFDFSSPHHRITRFHSVFGADNSITNPVDYLQLLHNKSVLKGRFPAQNIINQLCCLLAEFFDIETTPWMEKTCDFTQEWEKISPPKQEAILPLIDIIRHVYDASPFKGYPLLNPGIVLFERPDRMVNKNLFPVLISVLDQLLPNVQFILRVSNETIKHFPNSLKEQYLPIPNTIKKPLPKAAIILDSNTVGLLDVDSRIPNLALMKLSQHFKNQGKKIRLIRKSNSFQGTNTVFASCVFNSATTKKKIASLKKHHGERIVFGGSGYNIENRLEDKIEHLEADYSLYPELSDRAIGFLTRGCPNKCSFCIVPQKEGKVKQVSSLDALLQSKLNKLILLDDNILAHPKVNDLLEEMVKKNLQVNFNQTLDIRRIDVDKAKLLKQIKCSNIRFSRSNYYFSLNDNKHLEQIERNYRLFDFKPSDNVAFICMYGYNTNLKQDLERFRFLRTLPGAYVFSQRYQPILGKHEIVINDYFDHNADEAIDELIRIIYKQNMKSMEVYYRWLSRQYAKVFGKLHKGLVDTIFRYNYKVQKGKYIATLAGLNK
ncbi:MAG: hypothetical protein HOD92_05325, partial [Deltaproteobacteria bacterium]|nr:hypothetical protein [Deltaproteobacteria bacterium]